MLYLDGGVVVVSSAPGEFVGFTAATFNGNLGGLVGATQKCAAEFPNSWFCTLADFDRANLLVAPGGVGAWIDGDRPTAGSRSTSSCQGTGGAWTGTSSGVYGYNLTSVGAFYGTVGCQNVKPLACSQTF